MSRFHCITALLFTCLPLPGLAAAATGTQSVAVSLTATPSSVQAGSPVSLTAVVQPQGGTSTIPARPTGSITFFDGSTPLNSGALPLTPQSGFASATFQQAVGTVDASLAKILQGAIAADLNNDGSPDLLIYGQQTNSSPLIVQTFTSNSTNTYTANATQALNFSAFEAFNVGAAPVFMDVNDDGKQDILYGISVAYGNGDGTFQQPAALSFLASNFAASYAADVNGDGKIDIIAVNTPPSSFTPSNLPPFRITVFLNGGGGTFMSAGTFSIGQQSSSSLGVGYYVYQLVFADVNGDGKIDLIAPTATQNEGQFDLASYVGVLLNNGDGTFGSPQDLTIPTAPNGDYSSGSYFIQAADLNADGKQDLVLSFNSSFANSDAMFFPGNGDGTFGTPVSIPINLGAPHASPLSGLPNFLIYDVNLDGKPDIVFGDGEVVINSGNATFNVGTPLFPLESSSDYFTFPLISMLLPQNSVPSLIFSGLGFAPPGSLPSPGVFTPLTGSSGTIAVSTLAPAEHTLTAQYSGDTNYSAVTSMAQTVTVSQAASSTNLTSSANPSYASQNVTFTASVSSSGPSPSGTVTFSSGPNVLEVATLSGGTASFATSISTAESYIINASYSGDTNTQPSSGSLTQVVAAALSLQPDSGGGTTLTVKSGQSVTTPLSIVPAAGFSGTLTFSCSGLPANAVCSFSPASMALTPGAAASTILTVSTGASNTANLVHDALAKNLGRGLCSFSLASLLLLWFPRKRTVALRALLCTAIAFVFFGISGCGGSGPKTPAGPPTTTPGTYTFTVSATSANVAVSSTYSLVVQ